MGTQLYLKESWAKGKAIEAREPGAVKKRREIRAEPTSTLRAAFLR
jgi:hypothetical protein